MSNTVITLLVVLAFAAGLGLGLVTILRPRRSTPVVMSAKDYKDTFMRKPPKTESTVYFGRDDNDDPNHPHDIERAASHRYDGMTDSPVTKDEYGNSYLSGGLDFADRPR
jgi:hypothetical protein